MLHTIPILRDLILNYLLNRIAARYINSATRISYMGPIFRSRYLTLE